MILIIFKLNRRRKNTNVIGEICQNVRVFDVFFREITGIPTTWTSCTLHEKIGHRTTEGADKKLVSKTGVEAAKSNYFACSGVQKACESGVLNVRVFDLRINAFRRTFV